MGLISRLKAPVNKAKHPGRKTGSGPAMSPSFAADSAAWDADQAKEHAASKKYAAGAPERNYQASIDDGKNRKAKQNSKALVQEQADIKTRRLENNDKDAANRRNNPKAPFGEDPEVSRT